MTRDFFVDISAGKLVASAGSTQPVSPTIFFGDSLNLTVTFLRESGIVGNPLTAVSFSGVTVELGIGTLGGGTVITAGSWSDASGSVTGSVSIVTTGSSTASAVQNLAFSSDPSSGSFALTMAGTTGSFSATSTGSAFSTSSHHGLVPGENISLSWTGQYLPALSSNVPDSGTFVVYSTPTPTSFTVTTAGGTAALSSALGYGSVTVNGTAYSITDFSANTFTVSGTPSLSTYQTVVFPISNFSGVTAGTTYYVYGSPTGNAFQISNNSSGSQTPITGITANSFSGSWSTPAQTTALISLPALNSDIQAALSALTSIGTGNVLVTGNSPTFTISFVNQLANVAIPAMSLASSVSSVPSKSATLSVTGSTLKNLMTSSASLILEIASVSGGVKSTLCQSPVTVSPTLFS